MADDKKISELDPTLKPQDSDYLLTANEGVDNKKITFADLSQAAADKVQAMYLTGVQNVAGEKTFTAKPKYNNFPLLDKTDLVYEAVLLTGNQTISGNKNFEGDFGVSGDFTAGKIGSLENIEGIAGATIMTDGRDPDLFGALEADSLLLAFKNGVYITGQSTDATSLHVQGKIVADTISSLDNIVGVAGGTVMTDGRDPDLFVAPETDSLLLAFKQGVYITGEVGDTSSLHVQGNVSAGTISSLENIVGVAGATVMTDGRDPDLFTSNKNSLVLAFQDGVNITGSDLSVDGALYAGQLTALENVIGVSGSTVITDGRDPDLFPNNDKTLTFAFESGAYITGSNLHVEGTGFFKEIQGMSPIVIKDAKFIGETKQADLKDFIYTYWKDNQSAGDVYIPLHPGEGDAQENMIDPLDVSMNTLVTPHAGRVSKILLRSRTANPGNVKFKVYRASDGDDVTDISDYTLRETSNTETTITDTTSTFSFSNSHFLEGEVLAIACNRTITSSNGFINVTVELEYDTT